MKKILFIFILLIGCTPYSKVILPVKELRNSNNEKNILYQEKIGFVKMSDLMIKLDINTQDTCDFYFDSLKVIIDKRNLSFRHSAFTNNVLYEDSKIKFVNDAEFYITLFVTPPNDSLTFINNGLFISGEKIAIDSLIFNIDIHGNIHKLAK